MDGLWQILPSRSGAIDAQRDAVQRSQLKANSTAVASLLMTGAMLSVVLMPLAAHAASGPGAAADKGAGKTASLSGIAGVVRDAQGVVQMGALVQVLTANSTTVATAFTDQHGRYSVANLAPGRYLVRASATLFVPVTRANLQLRTGATAVVNLTLAALYDTASWLPAQRRRADETSDDWKWTLRSTANRPILRMVEEGTMIEVSSSARDNPRTIRVRALEAIESGDGGFGQGGVHNVVTLHEGMDDGSDVMLRADLGAGMRGVTVPTSAMAGTAPGIGAALAGSEFDAGYEGRTGFNGGVLRTVVSYKSHPELVGTGFVPGTQGGSGLQVMEITSAQRMAVGENIEVEAGDRIEAIREGVSAVQTHPFFRVSVHPTGEWTLEYRLASDRGVQQFDDVTSGDSDVPVALVRNGHLAVERGFHQEIAIGRRAPKASVQVTFYHDGISGAAIAGGETGTVSQRADAAQANAGVSFTPVGILLDPTTGSFRTLAAGYTSEGARVSVSSALTPALWVAAEYSTGEALTMPDSEVSGMPVGLEEALAELHSMHSQTATIALKGRLVGAGTRVRASYRWQPTRGVTAVDGYSSFGDQAYLNCMVRQPIRLGQSLPQGLEATIDVTNLLAQGYRPFLSADGHTLYFAQAPRTIQAGLSFSF
jgi:hypothetical protein